MITLIALLLVAFILPSICWAYRTSNGCECQYHLTPKSFLKWERWKFESELVTVWDCLSWHYPLGEGKRFEWVTEIYEPIVEEIKAVVVMVKNPMRDMVEKIFSHGHGYGYSKVRSRYFASAGITNELSFQYVSGMIECFRDYSHADLSEAYNIGRRMGQASGEMVNLASSGKCMTDIWRQSQITYTSEREGYRKFLAKKMAPTRRTIQPPKKRIFLLTSVYEFVSIRRGK